MTYSTLNSALKNLCPDSVPERCFDGFESDDSALIDEVVSVGKSMGPEVESEDVHELLKCHEIELCTQSSNPSPISPSPHLPLPLHPRTPTHHNQQGM